MKGIPREMPKRLIYYIIAFMVCAIAFALFFWSPIVDALIFAAFVLSSLALVYSRDQLPKSQEMLEIPEVHYYYRRRINPYGYAMATMLVIISLLYAVFSVFLNVRSGIVILILWFIAIICTYFITKKFATQVDKNSSAEFIINKLQLDQEKAYNVKILIDYLSSNNVKQDSLKFHEKNIIQLCSDLNIATELRNQVITEFFSYSNLTSKKVSSSEIEAVNSREML